MCQNLHLPSTSSQDPMCVMYLYDVKSESYMEFDRTEIVRGSKNPCFAKKFTINYFFNEIQKVKFQIYCINPKRRVVKNEDAVVSVELTLGEIVATGGELVRRLDSHKKSNMGYIIFSSQEVESSKRIVTMNVQGHWPDAKNRWLMKYRKSCLFLVFHKILDDLSTESVYTTEVVNPGECQSWEPIVMRLKTLAEDDEARPFRVTCHRWISDGRQEQVGEFTTTIWEFKSGRSRKFQVHHSKKGFFKKKKQLNPAISFDRIGLQSFLDYIKGGMRINMTVAIDFTQKNGPQKNSKSLHYIDPHKSRHILNQYAATLCCLGRVLQHYNKERIFSALGFGARLLNETGVSQNFTLNFRTEDPLNPFCKGVEGVLSAYYSSLKALRFSSPRNFTPVIDYAAKCASYITEGSEYNVLLIITCGMNNDMEDTIKTMVEASHLPLSIIIVGIGDASYEDFKVFNDRSEQLSDGVNTAERCTVTFVCFRDFLRGGHSMRVNQALLGKNMLEDLPNQILSHMSIHSIKAKPPVADHVTERLSFFEY